MLIDNEEDLLELYYSGLLDDQELDQLLELFNNPLDINVASREALFDLPGITQTTADAIVRLREEHGSIEAEMDLITLPGVGDKVFEQILPFIEELPPVRSKVPVKGVITLRGGKTIERIENPSDNPHTTHKPEQLGYGKWPDFYLRGKLTVVRREPCSPKVHEGQPDREDAEEDEQQIRPRP